MATGFFRVEGTQIVDGHDRPIILRGSALGGWMNMENFLNGFPGMESGVRAAMRQAMGEESYEFFFDRWLHYFFTEEDAKLFKSLGLNCLQLPFNHRHFDDDRNSCVLKESGFKHLDCVIKIWADHEIYTILDLHSVPGGQNQDWHSDNPTKYAAFWDYKDHQDRTVWLWQQIAERYKVNTWIAGYNPMNEPADPSRTQLAPFYARLEKAVRAIDPNHILYLDGNTYAMEWDGFQEMMGFPEGELYRSTPEQDEKLEKQFLRKCQFNQEHGVPIWNGEFGPTYVLPEDPNSDDINRCRVALMRKQIEIYEKYGVSWSTWPYKDIGYMGMLATSQKSPWNKLVWPFVDRKQDLYIDGCSIRQAPAAEAVIDHVAKWIDEVSPAANATYPLNWDTRRHIVRTVFHTFLAASLYEEFAGLFVGKTHEELEELAKSFSLEQCVLREDLNDVLRQNHIARS